MLLLIVRSYVPHASQVSITAVFCLDMWSFIYSFSTGVWQGRQEGIPDFKEIPSFCWVLLPEFFQRLVHSLRESKTQSEFISIHAQSLHHTSKWVTGLAVGSGNCFRGFVLTFFKCSVQLCNHLLHQCTLMPHRGVPSSRQVRGSFSTEQWVCWVSVTVLMAHHCKCPKRTASKASERQTAQGRKHVSGKDFLDTEKVEETIKRGGGKKK